MSLVLDEELARMYAAALYTITRADGAVDREENAGLRALILGRWQLALDPETLFFTTVTPESFAHAVRRLDAPFRDAGRHTPRRVGQALVEDATALSIASGGLDDDKAEAILRFARALGCSTEDIRAASDQLSAWLDA
jgi:tellurite resistance protein